MLVLAQVLIAASALGIASVFCFYPLVTWLLAGKTRPTEGGEPGARTGDDEMPTVSVIVAVRNGRELLAAKLENLTHVDYPAERLEIIVSSDGSTDGTAELARAFVLAHPSATVHVLESTRHVGKATALNRAVSVARNDVLVFSDADALWAPEALRKLVSHYADPTIGGVCGRRVIGEADRFAQDAQSRYVSLDSAIKVVESRGGSITSNDGKFHSLRRSLFAAIPDGVTDDLYVCLTAVARRHRFVFEPEARAFIRLPARNARHEIERRRRIVSRSLRGILLYKRLLNPLRYGRFAVGLAINKVVRRLLPFCLVGLFAGSLLLALESPWGVLLAVGQGVFYTAAWLHAWAAQRALELPLGRVASSAYYFCLGNWGTLLGVIDFAANKQLAKWDPIKTDSGPSRSEGRG